MGVAVLFRTPCPHPGCILKRMELLYQGAINISVHLVLSTVTSVEAARVSADDGTESSGCTVMHAMGEYL